jgi:hypothetical protein
MKKVSFELEKNELDANTQLYEDELCDVWYSSKDIHGFRRHTVNLVQAMLKSRQFSMFKYEKIITRAYVACCEAIKENDQVLTCYESRHLMHCVQPKLLGLLDKYQ